MVVSDITGFRELIADGEEAVLVPKQRAAAWAEAILELLGDRARLEAMSAAGRRKAEDYAWPRIAEQVMGVYRRVMR
jgi:phosphatidylinositol alpha-mannosyltransferase